MREQIGKVLEAADIANAIVYAAAQPKHVSINEILVRSRPDAAHASPAERGSAEPRR